MKITKVIYRRVLTFKYLYEIVSMEVTLTHTQVGVSNAAALQQHLK